MGANILDIEKITISDKYNNEGFLHLAFAPSQCLFGWLGSKGAAESVYKHVQEVMKESELGYVHFGELFLSDAARGNCAHIMTRDILSPQQKYKIAEGVESKGYTIKIEPRRF